MNRTHWEKLKADPERYAKKKKRDAEYVRQLRKTPSGWLKMAIVAARARAKRKGITFTVTAEDITLPTHCPVFGSKLDYGVVRKKGTSQYNFPNGPSLDRVDPDLGYTSKNTRVISQRANALKSNGTAEEFRNVIKYMETHDG